MILLLKTYWQYIIIGLMSLYILSNLNCSGEDKSTRTQKIKIPEVTGKIDKPIAIVYHKGTKDSIVYRPGVVIRTENPINKKMAEELIQAMKDNDSLKVLNLYLSSIEENEETRIFSDKNQTIEVYTKTRGTLLNQKISKYTIFEKEVEVKVPVIEPKFAVYTGATLKYTKELKLVPAAQIGVQVSKRLIITGEAAVDGSYQGGFLYKLKL